MAGTSIAFEGRARDDRADLLPVLRESFSDIYVWHARRILSGEAMVRAAMRNGVPVGLVMVKMLGPGTGYVYYVAVSCGERRHGTGGLLLDEAIAHLTAMGASTILACVTRANIPSERLMASRGFLGTRFSDLARLFGVFGAARLWMGMTVAPGEKVTMRQSRDEAAPRTAAERAKLRR